MTCYRVPNINSIKITGNLTQDPVIHTAQTTNATVANIRIAWSEVFKTRSGKSRERICYISVCAWLRLAELCRTYLKKGDKVYVKPEYDEGGKFTVGKSYPIVRIGEEAFYSGQSEIYRVQPYVLKDDDGELIFVDPGWCKPAN